MRRALVIIDYQNDFVTGSLGSDDAKALESVLHSHVSDFLARGEDVYFTKDTHGDDYASTDEGRHIPVAHCLKGTEGWEIHGSLRGLSERCTVLEKGTFGSTELAEIIRDKGYDEVEVCGVATNICVLANAVLIKAYAPECRVIVDRRHVASYDRSLGESALKVMASMCIDVTGDENR